MNIQIKFVVILILSSCISSCALLFETDLSKELIELDYPKNEAITTDLTIDFSWSELEGAETYQIQIASPNFEKAAQLICDCTLTTNSVTYQLSPDSFEWRVKGLNQNSETSWSTRSIVIDTTLIITDQIILLESPSDSTYTNSSFISFHWKKIYNADFYTFRIVEGNTFSSTNLFQPDHQINEKTIDLQLEPGKYYWGVKGQNATSKTETKYSSRMILVDQTPPGVPDFITPLNNAVITTQPITFSWEQIDFSEDEAPVYYTVEVTDSLGFSSPILSKTIYETYFQDSLPIGTYYMRIRAIDEAGNVGTLSVNSKFTVN